MRKVCVERKGETNFFTQQMIKDCMKKVVAVNLHQTLMVDDELEIKAYYAGHVLGGICPHFILHSLSNPETNLKSTIYSLQPQCFA